uniref:Uncharacterized protein n=1 Tax=Panagrolaimus superbus TaxID=310955 RepID=A0A914Z5E5_9BILA
MFFQPRFQIFNYLRKFYSINSSFLLCIFIISTFYSTVVSSSAIDYDEMSQALKEQKIVHTSNKYISNSKPCLEIADRNVTFLKAISKKGKKLVDVSPLIQYDVAFCTPESEAKTKCAPDSRCTTVYSKSTHCFGLKRIISEKIKSKI